MYLPIASWRHTVNYLAKYNQMSLTFNKKPKLSPIIIISTLESEEVFEEVRMSKHIILWGGL